MFTDYEALLRIGFTAAALVAAWLLTRLLAVQPFNLAQLGQAWLAILLGIAGLLLAKIVVEAFKIMSGKDKAE